MDASESRLLLQKIEILQQEMSELRGRLEVQEHEIQQLKKQSTVEAVPSASSVSSSPLSAPTAPQGSLQQATAAESSNLSEQESYDQAFLLVSQKQYDEALAAFEIYLKQFPNGVHAIQAHYWMGEIYFLQWQSNKEKIAALDNAIQAFLTVTSQEQNPKALDALLKLGLIEVEKGNRTAARKYLTELKKRAPDSTAAKIAESELKKLN